MRVSLREIACWPPHLRNVSHSSHLHPTRSHTLKGLADDSNPQRRGRAREGRPQERRPTGGPAPQHTLPPRAPLQPPWLPTHLPAPPPRGQTCCGRRQAATAAPAAATSPTCCARWGRSSCRPTRRTALPAGRPRLARETAGCVCGEGGVGHAARGAGETQVSERRCHGHGRCSKEPGVPAHRGGTCRPSVANPAAALPAAGGCQAATSVKGSYLLRPAGGQMQRDSRHNSALTGRAARGAGCAAAAPCLQHS